MSEDIFRIVYKSAAAHPAEVMAGQGHLASLLATARRRNHVAGVSGVLVYTGLGFFQVLEGPRSGVQSIFESILVDRRHHTLAVIEMDVVAERRFAGWAMGFLGTTRELDERLNGVGLGPVGGPESLDQLLRRTLLVLVDSPISLPWLGARAALDDGLGSVLGRRF
ncbi:BLUF domain-containing protein [Methylobacterium terricola]|uniref:BLUF domain-containing protein n=1 Tax=Methylobacterium terricola TaxID=2583531 RepID=A0A5C4LNR0_9HYPH|nr:BLUF domain-containing protein [Methylobacterium terricola]TNC15880.1 BLUF domain-containing protein [Methylobacterium terricola]